MTIDSSNMTNTEYFQLNGTLSSERIEQLLGLEKKVEKTEQLLYSMRRSLEEIAALFPSEEFMEDSIQELNIFAGFLGDEYSDTRKDMEDLINRVTVTADTVSDDAVKGVDYVMMLITAIDDNLGEN